MANRIVLNRRLDARVHCNFRASSRLGVFPVLITLFLFILSNVAIARWGNSSSDGTASAWIIDRGVSVSLGCNLRLGTSALFATIAGAVPAIPGPVFKHDVTGEALLVLEMADGSAHRYSIQVQYVAADSAFVGQLILDEAA